MSIKTETLGQAANTLKEFLKEVEFLNVFQTYGNRFRSFQTNLT